MRVQAAIIFVIVLLTGCASPVGESNSPADSQGNQVKALEARIGALERERDELKQSLERFQAQVDEQQKEINERGQAYRKALSSPGYGVAVRLLYSRLQSGDDSLLRSLIPADQYVEAGFILKGSSTYRGHDRGAAVDLRSFAQWAAGHSLSLAKVEVFARQEGYAWVFLSFPDGTYFRVFFHDQWVEKVLVTDQPFDL